MYLNDMKRRGVAVIFSLFVLILLAILGLTFVILSKSEMLKTKNLLKYAKAELSAYSGIEFALLKIPQDLSSNQLAAYTARWTFHGEDKNLNGLLDPGEDINQNGFLDIVSLPLSQADNPSYSQVIRIPTQKVSVTGAINKGNEIITYKLRIIDQNSRIYINGGNLLDPSALENKPIERILNTIGKFINIPDLGTKLIKNRPRGGYRFYSEFSSFLSPSEIEKVKEFISFYAYTYRDTIRPLGLSYRFSSEVYPKLEVGEPLIAWKQLEPEKVIIEPRAPVNINQARREILIALLLGLQGFYIEPPDEKSFSEYKAKRNKAIEEFSAGSQQSQQEIPPVSKPIPYSEYKAKRDKAIEEFSAGSQQSQREIPPVFKPIPYPIGIIKLTTPISLEQAQKIADRIIQRRKEKPFLNFTGRDGFNEFCDKLYLDKIIDAYQRDVLKANFNPNTDINFYNPNSILWKEVDKLALTTYSQEFSFYPMGYFSIDSLGSLWQNDKIVTEVELHTDAKLYDVWYDTTQKDFFGDSFINIGEQISSAYEENISTRLNLSLSSYPIPPNPFIGPSILDGQIALATLKGLAEKDAKFTRDKVSFDSFTDLIQTAADEGGYPRLFPDGVYSEIHKTLHFSTIETLDTEIHKAINKRIAKLSAKRKALEKKEDALEKEGKRNEEQTRELQSVQSEIDALKQYEAIPVDIILSDTPVIKKLQEMKKQQQKGMPKITKDILFKILDLIKDEDIETITSDKKFTVNEIKNAKKILQILLQMLTKKLKWFVHFIPANAEPKQKKEIVSFTTPHLNTASPVNKIIPDSIKNWISKVTANYRMNQAVQVRIKDSQQFRSTLRSIVHKSQYSETSLCPQEDNAKSGSVEYNYLSPDLTSNRSKYYKLEETIWEEEKKSEENCPTPIARQGVKWTPNFCKKEYFIDKESFVNFFKNATFSDMRHQSWGAIIKDESVKTTKDKILYLLDGGDVWAFPHNACWWDIYSSRGDIHFYPPEFSLTLIRKVFKDQPDILEVFTMQWKKSFVCWFQPNIAMWIKPNFVETLPQRSNNYSKEQIILSLTNNQSFAFTQPLSQIFFISIKPTTATDTISTGTIDRNSYLNKKKLYWRINDGFNEEDELTKFKGTLIEPKEFDGEYNEIHLMPHRWYHLGFVFTQYNTSGCVTARPYQRACVANDAEIPNIYVLGGSNISKRLSIYLNGKLIDTKAAFARVKSFLDAANPSLGIRFGELNNRTFGNLKDENDPWLNGYSGADTTYDEITTLNEVKSKEEIKELNTFLSQIYEKGRYYPGKDALFTSQKHCFPPSSILLRVSTNTWLPNDLDFELYFQISQYKKESNTYEFSEPFLISSRDISSHNQISKPIILSGNTRYRLILRNRAGKLGGLLETPFIDDILLFVRTKPIFQQTYHSTFF